MAGTRIGIHQKRTLNINIPCLMETHDTTPLLCFQTSDIVSAIQASHCAITGDGPLSPPRLYAPFNAYNKPCIQADVVQIGVADEHNSEYTEVFVSAKPSELMASAHNPEVLYLSQSFSPALCLRIDFVRLILLSMPLLLTQCDLDLASSFRTIHYFE